MRTKILAAMPLLLLACSTATEDFDHAEGANSVNVEQAKVFLCDRGGEDEGCAPCSQKIGSYELTEQEREGCTLKDLRGGLRDRIRFLVAHAGRQGAFLRSVSGDAPVRLKEIKVVPAVGRGDRPREDVYTKLAGSFTVGEGDEQRGANGGVDIHSVRMSVRFAFVFEDSSGNVVRNEPFVMHNTYNFIPFFYAKTSVGLNLSVGGILSSFAGAPEIANSLLAVLGGNAGLHLEAQHEVKWAASVCADTANDRSDADASRLRVFDYDFFKTVLKPVCEQYKVDHAGDTGTSVNCDFTSLMGDTETYLEQSKKLIGNRRVLPLADCRALDQSRWLGVKPVYDVSFVAPERWGWAPNHEAWLYQSDALASNVWQRKDWVRVFGVESEGSCGKHALVPGEVCVHAELARAFFTDECAAASGGSAPTLGVAQSEGTDGKILQSVSR